MEQDIELDSEAVPPLSCPGCARQHLASHCLIASNTGADDRSSASQRVPAERIQESCATKVGGAVLEGRAGLTSALRPPKFIGFGSEHGPGALRSATLRLTETRYFYAARSAAYRLRAWQAAGTSFGGPEKAKTVSDTDKKFAVSRSQAWQ